MSEPALKSDVIAALRKRPGVSVIEMADGSIEVSREGDIKRFPISETVPRNFCRKLERWYGTPMADFFPPFRVRPKTDAAGE